MQWIYLGSDWLKINFQGNKQNCRVINTFRWPWNPCLNQSDCRKNYIFCEAENIYLYVLQTHCSGQNSASRVLDSRWHPGLEIQMGSASRRKSQFMILTANTLFRTELSEQGSGLQIRVVAALWCDVSADIVIHVLFRIGASLWNGFVVIVKTGESRLIRKSDTK